jgi:predicted ArsR family transcriptional regulator
VVTDQRGLDAASQAPSIRAVAALEDELRRGMYAFCRRATRAVTRDEAAAEVGISRKLAAFHLDKLVDAGLLRAHHGPVGGIRKVGRAPKVYEPTNAPIHVAIPDRRHDLLADILIEAVRTQAPDEPATQTALRVATRRGTALGTHQRQHTRPGRLGAERALTLTETVLARHGFEPLRATPTHIQLRNCPFHPHAATAPDLVCRINHAFLTGLLTGLDTPTVHAHLTPTPGQCCVELTGR